MATPPSPSDLLRGTLDLLILQTLTLEPMHGWGISQRIEQISRGALDVYQGSLYPALQRLEQKGWVDSEWRITENNRRAKYYDLTTQDDISRYCRPRDATQITACRRNQLVG